MPADLSLQNLSKTYGNQTAVDDVSLDFAAGEFVALLGPSGCGKTTTLRMIAGFIRPTAGRILLAGRDVTDLPPEKRDMGMVFQNYALFPHMTVEGNVMFGLSCHGVAEGEARIQARAALETVGLSDHLEKYPRQLSGGQQQRVALSRVLALKPSLLLFDEPLSNLDAKLRVQMRSEIRRLQREIGTTAVFVTHDQEEAMAIADRIVILNRGRIEQIGTTDEIYDKPRSRFVADFIGNTNFFTGTVDRAGGATRLRMASGQVLDLSTDRPAGDSVTVSVRPEQILLEAAEAPGTLPGQVVQAVHLGAAMHYVVRLATGEQLQVSEQRRGPGRVWREGEAVGALWRAQDMIILAD